MVIVGGVFEVEPDQRDAFIAGRMEAMRISRAEKGCLEYTFSADPTDPGRVVLFEIWESQADLDAHAAAGRARCWWIVAHPESRSACPAYHSQLSSKFACQPS